MAGAATEVNARSELMYLLFEGLLMRVCQLKLATTKGK